MAEGDQPPSEVEESIGPDEYIKVRYEEVESARAPKIVMQMTIQRSPHATEEEALAASLRALRYAVILREGWEYIRENGTLEGFAPEKLTALERDD